MTALQKISGIYALVDPEFCGDFSPIQLVQRYLKEGVQLIQLRDKKGSRQKIFEESKKIMSLKKDFDFCFILNDDPELAREVGADGIHVGQNDMSPDRAREILGPTRVIGYSTHSLKELQLAQKFQLDYVACGAVFPTSSKPAGHPVLGLDFLKQAVEISRHPIVAIGGINRSNMNEVLKTGVAAVAMISGLL